MIWFISDTHFGHLNICYPTSNWLDKEVTTRKFKSLEEMNRTIVESINKYVKQDDTIYFLGDWCMGGIENYYLFWKQLICKNIKFIPGNHDQHLKKNKVIPGVYIDYLGNILESQPEHDHFRQLTPRDLFEVLPELTTLSYNKILFVLCHYPLDQWEDMDRGSIHIHGHTHGKLNDTETNTEYRRKDVGLDAGPFRPYSIIEVINDMKNRKIKKHVS